MIRIIKALWSILLGNTAFFPTQILGRDDLSIFLNNAQGQRQDAYSITYAIYDNTTGTEQLIGSATRTPEHPDVGEYYAYFVIPEFAPYGDYLIRWTFKQSADTANVLVVQEFSVVPEDTDISTSQKYTTKEWEMINSLRIMTRDNCVGGEEEVLFDVDGEMMLIRLDELWEILKNE